MLFGVYGEVLWVLCFEVWIVGLIFVLGSFVYGIVLGMVVMMISFFLIVFGEVILKCFVMVYLEVVVEVFVGLIMLLFKFVKLLVIVVFRMVDWVLQFFFVKGSVEVIVVDEICFFIEVGCKQGYFDQIESEMFGNVFCFDNCCVVGIMILVVDIVCFDFSLLCDENFKVLQKWVVLCFLVCKGGIVNVLGFVESWDLLQELLNGNNFDFGKLLLVLLYYVFGILLLIVLFEFFKVYQI